MVKDAGEALRRSPGNSAEKAVRKRKAPTERRRKPPPQVAAIRIEESAGQPVADIPKPRRRRSTPKKPVTATTSKPEAVLVAARALSPAKRHRAIKFAVKPEKRKPRVMMTRPCICTRGVTAKVQTRNEVPRILRCAGRRTRAGGGLKTIGALVLSHTMSPFRVPESGRKQHGHATVGSSWALPLPQMDEPLVQPAAPSPSLAPLERNRAPVVWRSSMVANVEAWLRGASERLGQLIKARSAKRPGKVSTRRVPPPVPAIARANREINALREENQRLRLRLEVLEKVRTGPGTPLWALDAMPDHAGA